MKSQVDHPRGFCSSHWNLFSLLKFGTIVQLQISLRLKPPMQKGLPHRCTPFLYTLFTNQKADKLLSSRDFQVNFHSTRAKPINVKDRSLFCSFFNTAVLVTVNFSSYPKQSGQYFHLPDKDCTTCWMIPGCQQTRPKESSTAAEGNPLPLLSTGSVISVTVQQIQSQGLTLLERSIGPPCSVTRSWEVLGQEVFSAAKPTQIIPQNKPGGFFFFFLSILCAFHTLPLCITDATNLGWTNFKSSTILFTGFPRERSLILAWDIFTEIWRACSFKSTAEEHMLKTEFRSDKSFSQFIQLLLHHSFSWNVSDAHYWSASRWVYVTCILNSIPYPTFTWKLASLPPSEKRHQTQHKN